MKEWIVAGWLHLVAGFALGLLRQKYLPRLWGLASAAEQKIADKIGRKL